MRCERLIPPHPVLTCSALGIACMPCGQLMPTDEIQDCIINTERIVYTPCPRNRRSSVRSAVDTGVLNDLKMACDWDGHSSPICRFDTNGSEFMQTPCCCQRLHRQYSPPHLAAAIASCMQLSSSRLKHALHVRLTHLKVL